MGRSLADLGWTNEEIEEVRAALFAWSDLWDDPALDVYNEVEDVHIQSIPEH
jgi:hypothetical protein